MRVQEFHKQLRFKNTFNCLDFFYIGLSYFTSLSKEKWRKKCCQFVDWNWISKDEKKKSTHLSTVYIFSKLGKKLKLNKTKRKRDIRIRCTTNISLTSETGHVIGPKSSSQMYNYLPILAQEGWKAWSHGCQGKLS